MLTDRLQELEEGFARVLPADAAEFSGEAAPSDRDPILPVFEPTVPTMMDAERQTTQNNAGAANRFPQVPQPRSKYHTSERDKFLKRNGNGQHPWPGETEPGRAEELDIAWHDLYTRRSKYSQSSRFVGVVGALQSSRQVTKA
jgi:hypothetical protein